MAVAETIKPSSSRKDLAVGFRLVEEGGGWGGGDRRGPLARQRRQHSCLRECAIAQSIALGCQITLEWTAATSANTPSVCHDATVCVSHHTLSGTQEEEEGAKGAEIKEEEREREGTVISVV